MHNRGGAAGAAAPVAATLKRHGQRRFVAGCVVGTGAAAPVAATRPALRQALPAVGWVRTGDGRRPVSLAVGLRYPLILCYAVLHCIM